MLNKSNLSFIYFPLSAVTCLFQLVLRFSDFVTLLAQIMLEGQNETWELVGPNSETLHERMQENKIYNCLLNLKESIEIYEMFKLSACGPFLSSTPCLLAPQT